MNRRRRRLAKQRRRDRRLGIARIDGKTWHVFRTAKLAPIPTVLLVSSNLPGEGWRM